MMTVAQKPLAVLWVPMAVLGFLSMACGAPGESSPRNPDPTSETFDPNHEGTSTVLPTLPFPQRDECIVLEVVPSSGECPGSTTAGDTTTTTAPGQLETSPNLDYYGDDFNPDVTCFEQTAISEEMSTEHARSMLPSLIELFVELGLKQSRALAVAYGLCGVMLPEAQMLVGEGSLGRQYRELVAALTADSYHDFREIYKRQPCILATMELMTHIKSETRLVRLISATETAALINFQPSDEELNTITLQSLSDILEIFDDLLNSDSSAQEPLIAGEIVTCEQFELSRLR